MDIRASATLAYGSERMIPGIAKRPCGRLPGRRFAACSLAGGVLLASLSPLLAAPVPSRADIAKIYNITPAAGQPIDVRFFRKGQCTEEWWCPIHGSGEFLQAEDWLRTGNVSRADLALMYNQAAYRTVLFWQEKGSRSKFDPRPGTCHFEVDVGSFLYAHAPDSVDKGCEKIISRHALIFPKGTALFIVGTEDQTTVGVLGSPNAPVTIQNKKPKQGPVDLKAGQYVTAFQDGTLQQREFSLAAFYKQNKLGLGLADSSEDNAYVLRQVRPIQDILNRIRRETVTALNAQKPSPEPPPEPPPGPGPLPPPPEPPPPPPGPPPPEPPPPPPAPGPITAPAPVPNFPPPAPIIK